MSESIKKIEDAIVALKAGNMVILVDDEDRENEGDLIFLAEKVSPEKINFMATHARGLICLPMAEELIDRLELPMMVEKNSSKFQTAFTVSIEAKEKVSTGISVADRAQTIKVAVDPNSKATDISTPGHIFPLRERKGGVLVRVGQTEGSVDLARLSGYQPAAVICEIMNEDGTMSRMPELKKFSLKHKIPIVSVNDIIAYRMARDCLVTETASAIIPIEPYGEFKLSVFTSTIDDFEHVVLQKGEINPDKPSLVRVHSSCLTGDVFGSRRCDCGWQLDSALASIAKEGGVLLYMHQEGRGIGLTNKIKAYALQEQGMDTVEANKHLGFKADHRDYGIGSQILRYLGIRKMRLLTNNPTKIYGLEGYGLEITSRESIEMLPHEDNKEYLATKRSKLGHILNFGENNEGN